MFVRYLIGFVVLHIFLSGLGIARGQAGSRVSARDFIDGKDNGKAIIIDVEKPDVLVFDDAAEYILYGRDLTLYADEIEVKGNVVVRAFPKGARGSDASGAGNNGRSGSNGVPTARDGTPGGNGENGFRGPAGSDGRAAGFITLKIRKMSGTGRITIFDNGTPGGKGGRGGNGGNGGHGGPGRNRDCGDFLGRHKASPGNGGNGGNAGNGGIGGSGGNGGNGGSITFNYRTNTFAENGKLLLHALGAQGGSGGPGGYPGVPGNGGGMGRGGWCGGGGRNGGPGAPGNIGPDGKNGLHGKNGTIRCYNCKKKDF